MKSPTTKLLAMSCAGVLLLSSATVAAQNVQRFDEEAGGEVDGSQVHVPGAPVQQQEQPEQQVVEQQADAEDGDDADAPVGSYRISVHGMDGPMPGAVTPEIYARDHDELYQGVIPGQRDLVAHIERSWEEGEQTGQPNQLTWVGFRPEDERTRVFFQSPRPAEYSLRGPDDGKLEVIFRNTNVSDRNFSRFIDASHFNRVVERIEVDEAGDEQVRVVLTLRSDVAPSDSTEGQYLYLDFPHDAGDGGDDTRARAE